MNYTRWRSEPRSHGDINHIQGCISPNGCSCAGIKHINPPKELPAYLRPEVAHESLGSDAEEPYWARRPEGE